MFSIDSPMPPVWMMYPNISKYSIGWRMGYGEGYKYDHRDWLDTLSCEDQKKYQEMFPRPIFWQEHNYDDMDHDDDSDEQEYWINDVFIQYWNFSGQMKYNKSMFQGKNIYENALFFWKPSNENMVDKPCLGQWQASPFSVDIDDYCCMEQYMMSKKALLFDDKEINSLIMTSNDPKEIKALGKKVRNFDQTIWNKCKYTIVLTGNYYKFTQNSAMRDYFLSTEGSILVEASPLDIIWGVGLSENNQKINDVNTWRGSNLLGFALMEVRDELKRLYKHYDKIDWSKIKKLYN